MTVYGYRGQVVHHNDCTYCRHRREVPAWGKKKRMAERCGLTGWDIPPPFQSHDIGPRFCKSYQQAGCECDQCQTFLATSNTVLFTNQMVDKYN